MGTTGALQMCSCVSVRLPMVRPTCPTDHQCWTSRGPSFLHANPHVRARMPLRGESLVGCSPTTIGEVAAVTQHVRRGRVRAAAHRAATALVLPWLLLVGEACGVKSGDPERHGGEAGSDAGAGVLASDAEGGESLKEWVVCLVARNLVRVNAVADAEWGCPDRFSVAIGLARSAVASGRFLQEAAKSERVVGGIEHCGMAAAAADEDCVPCPGRRCVAAALCAERRWNTVGSRFATLEGSVAGLDADAFMDATRLYWSECRPAVSEATPPFSYRRQHP